MCREFEQAITTLLDGRRQFAVRGAGARIMLIGDGDVAGVIAAAVSAATPRGSGVENCWKACVSSERRVCVGNRLAILASIGRLAAGDPDLRKTAFPYLRRNSTVATSQAS
mgnify:CR=1 FL=1